MKMKQAFHHLYAMCCQVLLPFPSYGLLSLPAEFNSLYFLSVLNGEHDATVNDPYAPTEVINALIRHDWVISPGEQDAHELFHILLETLEEEMTSHKAKVM